MSENELTLLPNAYLIKESEVPNLLERIRPSWQAKDLISRVRKLIDVDPSSACQRLFNASIHDLREKVVIAGIDIAKEAARQNKLPPVEKPEDIENYSTQKLVDLAYRMGLLSRPEWRRVSRCYEIRRDLEHEDNEYEAGVEDCIYIFKTCIEVVLERDPIHLLKVTDVKDVIEQPVPAFPSESLLNDFQYAPQPRQEEISRLLISVALDQKQSEIVRQNAFTLLTCIQPITQNPVKLRLAEHMQELVTRRGLDRLHVRVALAAGVLPYLKQSYVKDFFTGILKEVQTVNTHWSAYEQHGELLRGLQEIGGLLYCPPPVRREILKWLVQTFVGVRGGATRYGNVRPVFYSDTAEPLIAQIVKDAKQMIASDLTDLAKDKDISWKLEHTYLARRFNKLLDIVAASSEE